MIRKNWALPALAFPIVVLLIWTVGLQYLSLTAPRVMVTVEGYDPRSLISGHYLECSLTGRERIVKHSADKPVRRINLKKFTVSTFRKMLRRSLNG